MNPEALLDLAVRCEGASPTDVSTLLEEAYALVFPPPPPPGCAPVGEKCDNCGSTDGACLWRGLETEEPFRRLMAASAFLEAAMMLVPEGAVGRVSFGYQLSVCTMEYAPDLRGYGRVPALAVEASALRARAASADTLPKGRDGEAGSVRSKGSAVPNVSEGDAQP